MFSSVFGSQHSTFTLGKALMDGLTSLGFRVTCQQVSLGGRACQQDQDVAAAEDHSRRRLMGSTSSILLTTAPAYATQVLLAQKVLAKDRSHATAAMVVHIHAVQHICL